MEGWSLLAALAASTDRIRLGALVTGVTYRHPSILAAEAATVDNVSKGRLEFAIGAAWHDEEHRELGVDFPPTRERIDRLEEAVQVIRSCSGRRTERPSTPAATTRSTEPPTTRSPCSSHTRRSGSAPAGEKKTIPLAGRYADVWHGFGDVAGLKRKSAILDRAAEDAGRDPADIVRSTALSISEPMDEIKATAESLRGRRRPSSTSRSVGRRTAGKRSRTSCAR